MQYTVNTRPYWTAKVTCLGGVPLQAHHMSTGATVTADYYVFGQADDSQSGDIAGYIARTDNGLWLAFDWCGRQIMQAGPEGRLINSCQSHQAMALADVAHNREAVLAARRAGCQLCRRIGHDLSEPCLP